MAKEKLFKSAEELVEGYGLKSIKDSNQKRKVYLKGRILPSGNVALFYYSCTDYKIQRRNTGALLIPERNMTDKIRNKELLRLHSTECDTINADLERKDANFAPTRKNKTNVVDYIENLSQKALLQTGNKHSYYSTFHSLATHLERCFGHNIRFKDVDQKWILRFLSYLKTEAVNLNFVRTEDENRRKELPLSDNSQLRIYRNLNTVLSIAVKQDIIPINPCSLIDKKDKPKEKKGSRLYLELDEVKRLIETPFPATCSTADFRDAFLFACCTALRYSDLQKISQSDIKTGQNGTYIEIIQTKTKEPLKIYLDDFALSFIPKRERTKEEPLFKLPKNANANDNVAFKKWFVDAKIEKHITWHCARHTTATIMLSNNIPLAVVSAQLGHSKISTTQIYAKIVDKAQAEAATRFSKLFADK